MTKEDINRTTGQDKTLARNALFPELEDQPDTYLTRLQFSDEAYGQILRVADAISAMRHRAYDAGYRAADNGNDPDPEWHYDSE